MERLVYLDALGNERHHNEVSLHHVFPRCKMKGTGERAWANLEGLRLPMLNIYHNLGKEALHSNVQLAPKPEKDLMYDIRQNLYQNADMGVYDRFLGVLDYLYQVAETYEGHRGWHAGRIAENLTQQAPYILQGQVTIIGVES